MNTTAFSKFFLPWMSGRLAQFGTAALVFLVGWFLIRLFMGALQKALARSPIDVTLHAFLRSLIKTTLIVLLCVTCAALLGVPVTSLVTVLGAVGLAISLAVKDSLSNLAGGLILLWTKPFSVGDYIETEDGGGTVARIDLIHTLLLSVDNKQIYIPNGKISNARVTNFSAETLRRVDVEFSIASAADLPMAKEVILKTVLAHPLALKEPAPFVRLNAQKAGLLVLACRVWVENKNYWVFYHDAMEQVVQSLSEAGIAPPSPLLDVHLCEKK